MLTHMLPNARLVVCPGEGHLMVMDEDSVAHPQIREFLSAEVVEKTKVWKGAATVDAQELKVALFGAPLQLPPLSVINATMRRRWLPKAGSSRPVNENEESSDGRRARPVADKQRAAG
jgi:hypothetical protein